MIGSHMYIQIKLILSTEVLKEGVGGCLRWALQLIYTCLHVCTHTSVAINVSLCPKHTYAEDVSRSSSPWSLSSSAGTDSCVSRQSGTSEKKGWEESQGNDLLCESPRDLSAEPAGEWRLSTKLILRPSPPVRCYWRVPLHFMSQAVSTTVGYSLSGETKNQGGVYRKKAK
ncbi:hypothetical protein AOLI_G00313830 [Acnodon oligacanthus]